MKTLITLLLLAFITGCQSVEFFDEETQKEETTIKIVENVDTTLKVSIIDDKIYLLNQDNMVVHHTYNTTSEYGANNIPIIICFSAIAAAVFIFISWSVKPTDADRLGGI